MLVKWVNNTRDEGAEGEGVDVMRDVEFIDAGPIHLMDVMLVLIVPL